MSNCINFPVNRTRFYLSFTLTVGLFLFATWFLIFGKPTIKDLPPVLCFDILYLWVIIIFVKRQINLAPNHMTALELSGEGIYDHMSNFSVKWKDVSGIGFVKIKSICYIAVYVYDNNAIIRSNTNVFSKILFYFNMLFMRTPVTISLAYIKGKNADIFDAINNYFMAVSSQASIR